MKRNFVKRLFTAVLAASLVITGVGATDVSAAEKETVVQTSTEEEATESTESKEADTNLLTNGEFESDASGWTFTLGGETYEPTVKSAGSDQWMSNNTTGYINVWTGSEQEFVMSQEVADLSEGMYTATIRVEGESTSSIAADLKFYANDKSVAVSTDGYNSWTEYKIEDIAVEEAGSVTVKLAGTIGAEYWMDIDDVTLTKNQSAEEEKETAVSELNSLITACKALSESDYTADSWSALQTAITAAEVVAADAENKTVDEINEAVTALQEAKDA